MLRVTVELIPGGRESGKRILAVAEIGNVGGASMTQRARSVAEFVPTHTEEGRAFPYVLMAEIPEPARSEFSRRMSHSTVPMRGAAYLHDWQNFLRGHRQS